MIQLFVLISLFNALIATPIHKSLDWRTKGAVLPVPNQGQCGSSPVFNALDVISAAQKIKHGGQLTKLSIQQVYDCTGSLCPCAGDLSVTKIYDLILDEKFDGLIDSEQSYPFTGLCNKQCNFKKSGAVTQLQGYTFSEGNTTEQQLYSQLQNGPVTVDIQANTLSFQIYTKGIFDDPSCKGDQLDHTMLVVGYGTENGVDYWIARNSWGSTWGEEGYIRIVRNKKMCGIGTKYTQPFVV